MPLWVPITLLCALCLAASDTVIKRAMHEGTGEYLSGWLRVALAALPLSVLAFIAGIPEIRPGFYIALAIGIPFEVVATFLYTRALKVSPMSLTLPFLAFTPVFVIATGFVFAGEMVSAQGILGIVLIAGGSYMLNIHHIWHHTKGGILGPLRAIGRERGSSMMLVVSLIYAVTATMIKVGINNSSPLFFGAVYFTVFSVAYAPIGLRQVRVPSARGAKMLMLAGALIFVSLLAHVISVSMTEVAYMVSVKRTSLLFGVLLGYFFFRERNIKERIAGASLMLAGFILVVLSAG